MILEFLLSLVAVFAVSVFCVIVSGGALPIFFNPALLAETIGILAVFIFYQVMEKISAKFFQAVKSSKHFR